MSDREDTLSKEAQVMIRELVLRERRRFIAMIVSFVVITTAFFGYSIRKQSEQMVRSLVVESVVENIHKAQADVRESIAQMRQMAMSLENTEMRRISELLSKLEDLPKQSDSVNLSSVTKDLVALQGEIEILKDSQSKSNELLVTLGEDPLKALTIPMLRKDIEHLQKRLDTLSNTISLDLAEIKASVTSETTRIYDLGKWFLGLILAASLIPIIEPLFKRKKVDKKSISTADDEEKDETNKSLQEDAADATPLS